jgi:tetratricopeptide (TPR) repeat protein
MSEAITLKDSGNSKFKAGDFDGAVADWQAAIKSNDGDNAFRCTCSSNIAMAYAKKSDWQNVFKFASSAIDCDDQHVKSYFRRGVALRHMGRTDEAKSDLQRALQLEDNPDVRKELSLCRDPTAKTGSVFANLGAALGKASLYDDKPVYVPPPPPPKPGPRQSDSFPYAWMCVG